MDDEDTTPRCVCPTSRPRVRTSRRSPRPYAFPRRRRPAAPQATEDKAEEAPGVADTTVALRLPSASVKVGHAPEAPAVPARGPQQAAPQGKQTRLASLVRGAPRWLPVVLVLEGLLMYVLALRVSPGPLRGVDPADIGGLGLISAMPLSAFFAIVIMIVSFFVTVTQSTDRKFLLLFQIAAITFALHGAGAIVADVPRFPTAYVHAGFVDFISRTGETAPMLDARMAWPGFFALFAFVGKARGHHRLHDDPQLDAAAVEPALPAAVRAHPAPGGGDHAGQVVRRAAVHPRAVDRPGLLLPSGLHLRPLPGRSWRSCCAGSARSIRARSRCPTRAASANCWPGSTRCCRASWPSPAPSGPTSC
ncbi:hypothetical protein [Nonomuraea dietziae]|uniref:hypothetical protein n=1 Tax=Nonomuraea dietziae TaxID=65515 RepID=UPI0031CFEF98